MILLFLRSSCTLIIKDRQEKISETKYNIYFFKEILFLNIFHFHLNVLALFFLFFKIPVDPLKLGLVKICEITNQLSLACVLHEFIPNT